MIHLLIKGRVQGVSYRVSAEKAANELNLQGWVRNTKEGHVEAQAFGSATDLQKFITWCHEGPQNAKVSEVVVLNQSDRAFLILEDA